MGKGQKKEKGSRKNGKSVLPFQLALGNAFSNAGAVISSGHLRYGLKFIDSLKQNAEKQTAENPATKTMDKPKGKGPSPVKPTAEPEPEPKVKKGKKKEGKRPRADPPSSPPGKKKRRDNDPGGGGFGAAPIAVA